MNFQRPPNSAKEVDVPGFYVEHSRARHETIRADVARRLRKACAHLSEEAFEALVARIVEVQLKSERGSTKKSS